MHTYRALIVPSRWLAPERLSAGGGDVLSPRPDEVEQRGSGPQLDEEGVGVLLAKAIENWGDRSRAESDAEFALLLRERLDLSRRAAADSQLWANLNAVQGWAYVVWRWRSGTKGVVGAGRVCGSLARSALGRLWWMAELARGLGEDRAATREEWGRRVSQLLASQDKAVQLYERPRLLNRPRLLSELLAEHGSPALDEAEFRAFAKACGGYFGVRLTGAMAPDDISEAVHAQIAVAAGHAR